MNNLKEISKNIGKDFKKENNIKLPKNREEILSKMTRDEKINFIYENLLLSELEGNAIITLTNKELNEYILKYTSSSINDIL